MKAEVIVKESEEFPIELHIGEDWYKMGIMSAITLQSLLTRAIEDALGNRIIKGVK